MIKVKWGKCLDCDPGEKDKPLTAKRCSFHHKQRKKANKTAAPVKAKSPIRKRSKAGAERIRIYSKIRAEWIVGHELCEMRIVTNCSFYATDVHHMKGKIGDLLFDTRWWKAGCRVCHRYIEDHPEEARQRGLTVNRLDNE